MLSMLYVRLTIKVKVGIPESFKVRCYPYKITGSSHLKESIFSISQYFETHFKLLLTTTSSSDTMRLA